MTTAQGNRSLNSSPIERSSYEIETRKNFISIMKGAHAENHVEVLSCAVVVTTCRVLVLRSRSPFANLQGIHEPTGFVVASVNSSDV
ncbi:hypothetical protein MUK42_12835 [Musa troglodytarum]|uniref:Uncharacterized protein n=1 Tax=Musa troglodytarum TaxID=320322 RepID=A0A9E7HGP4_9LILI|nr:hypothetical protein MUK42_12835 [Musa troglodytarum]